MATLSTTITYSEPIGSLVATLGAPGPSGQAATIAVGTTETGAPGTQASVLNIGTSSAAIFDFTIPRGDIGAQGQQGIQGIQGDPGQKGDKGDTGDAATVDAGSTTTGSPGSSASVFNSGTSSAAVFDFTIPRGDKGDQGDQGNPGPSGVVYATAPLAYDSGTQTISINLAAYLPKSGGVITGDIQSNNGSGYRSWDGLFNQVNVSSGIIQLIKSGGGGGALSVEWDGITFPGGKQTLPFLGLAGYATEAWVTNGFYPLTGNPSSFLTASALVGYATESFVTSQGYITQTTADGLYYPISGNPSGFIGDAPSDGSTYGRNNGAWTVAGGSGLITSVTSPLAVTSGDLSIDLTGYATESFVTSQGYITQGTADGLYYPLTGNPSGFLTSVPAPILTNLTSDISWDAPAGIGRLIIDGVVDLGGGFSGARVSFSSGVPSTPSTGDFWFNGTDFFYAGGGVRTIASQTWVTSQGYATTGQLSGYALLAGATFSGKLNTTITGTTAPINIGSQLTAPTTTVAGDLWIGANINYKSWDGVTKAVANTNTTNQFSQGQAITVNSAVNAFRINQQGTGPAFVVEDSVSPDATPFVIDANGKVGIGVAPDATAAIKIDGNGMSFNGLVFNPTATAAHTGGSDTLDLLVTINGTAYRIGLRPA